MDSSGEQYERGGAGRGPEGGRAIIATRTIRARRMTPARVVQIGAVLLLLSGSLSLVHPWGNLRANTRADMSKLTGAVVPPEVRRVLETKCVDCHSESTHWPVYSFLAPASWLLERDVGAAREQFNMSRWESYSRDNQIDLLTRIGSEARRAKMPPRQYLLVHPDAKLSTQEQQMIYEWTKAERRRLQMVMSAPK